MTDDPSQVCDVPLILHFEPSLDALSSQFDVIRSMNIVPLSDAHAPFWCCRERVPASHCRFYVFVGFTQHVARVLTALFRSSS